MAISHPAAQRGAWDLQGPLSKPLLPAQPLQAPCPACPAPGGPAAGSHGTAQAAVTLPCPEMQPARDWLLPSGVLVTSPTCTGGTLLVPVLHSVWAPGEFGHHHLALPSPGDAAAGSTTQPALGWGQLQLCPQGEGLPCPAAPQHAALQPQIPSPIPPERGRALWSQDEGTGGDSLP